MPSNAVFKAIEKIQETMENGFKAIEARIASLEEKVNHDVATQANSVGSCTPSPDSSGRKRKIHRNPDLSVSRLFMESRSWICCFCVCLLIGRGHILVSTPNERWKPLYFSNFAPRSASNFSHLLFRNPRVTARRSFCF